MAVTPFGIDPFDRQLPHCTWLVEIPTASLHTDPEYDWYPDSPSNVYTTVECGAELSPVDGDWDNGWRCTDGHHHFTYGSPRQQAEERDEATIIQLGGPAMTDEEYEAAMEEADRIREERKENRGA